MAALELATSIRPYLRHLKTVYSTWQQIQAAPLEVQEVGRQAEALGACVEALLEQVSREDSIIGTAASKDIATIERFIQGCTGKLDVLMEMQQKYSTKLSDGRRTWNATFLRAYNSFSWTKEQGRAEDLAKSIKHDIELVASIAVALQRFACHCICECINSADDQ